jgi:hypothetical protein
MKPNEILLRCYIERKEGSWQAFCIDLCLAAQGESEAEVKRKLHEQIYSYLVDIFEGEDQPYAAQLLNRKAPFSQIAKYHSIKFLCQLKRFKDRCTFQDTMPLKLA